jgi:hypothetical protein
MHNSHFSRDVDWESTGLPSKVKESTGYILSKSAITLLPASQLPE